MAIQSLSSAEIVKFHESGHKVSSTEKSSFFGEDGFTFGDILDIINPLQHIPLVNTFYRKLTGDTIAPSMQIAGDALFGGPIGAVVSIATTAVKSVFNSEDESTEPDPKEPDTTIIANNTLPNTPQAIGANDYAIASNITIDPLTNTYQQQAIKIQYSDAISPIISMDTAKHDKYKGAERYNEITAVENVPRKNVDIVIGAETHAG